MKKISKSSLKKVLLIYLSSIKTKLAINFLKKKLLHLAEKRAGAERVNPFVAARRTIHHPQKRSRSKVWVEILGCIYDRVARLAFFYANFLKFGIL